MRPQEARRHDHLFCSDVSAAARGRHRARDVRAAGQPAERRRHVMFQRDSAKVGRRDAGTGSSERWRTVIDRLLALQADVVADSELAVGARLSEHIDACRRAVAADVPTASLDPCSKNAPTSGDRRWQGRKGNASPRNARSRLS